MSNAASTTQTRTVKTSEIHVGDVVRTHGMRVRIDRIKAYEGSTGLPAASCTGTVLNLAEVLEEGYVPASFLRTRKSDGYAEDRDDFWNVQGNDLAMWQVEVPAEITQPSYTAHVFTCCGGNLASGHEYGCPAMCWDDTSDQYPSTENAPGF